jgi:porphobilinogen synthase
MAQIVRQRTARTTTPLRSRAAVRNMLEPVSLTPADLSMVILVTAEAADSGLTTATVTELPKLAGEYEALGIRSVKLFAEGIDRSATGESSVDGNSLMAQAIFAIKDTAPALAVMTETCLCSYTLDGTCYVVGADGLPDVAATLDVTARQAIAHADAGADIVGPASMMLGTTGAARRALDAADYDNVSVMPHVIFWSNLYDGFRQAMGATPKVGHNREFQVNPVRADQFVDAALRMEADGADMLLLEPAFATADVLSDLKTRTLAPIFPFSVSGEYTRLAPLDPATGKRDLRLLIELYTMLKRAGATAVVTYAAAEIARTLT